MSAIKKALLLLLCNLVCSFSLVAQTRVAGDSINAYLKGSWQVDVLKYFDGSRDGITRDIIISEKTLQVYETNDGMRKLKYSGELRVDSLDDGTPILYAYLTKGTATSNCNTLLFHVQILNEDSMTVDWFELYFLREEEKTNFYFAKCSFSRILD